VSDELITTLSSYAPALIKRRLAAQSAPITTPALENFSAAVLFADISGFTALAETLAQLGPAGAEDLTALLNTYFGQLIDIITHHGGDIVKFAGDALIALWPITDNGDALAAATDRAAHCGLRIQQSLNNFEAAPGIHLSMRLVLGGGDLLAMHLGGIFSRWEFLVAGEPLVQIGAIAAQANPGDLVLTPPAWDLLQSSADGTPLTPTAIRLNRFHTEESAPLPPRPPAPLPLSAAGLRAYIPGAILSRLDAGHSGWLAELRRVTVLFVNLPDLGYRLPLPQAQQIMSTLQQAIYRYEGSINKLSVDDKGVTLLAAFGLPPLSHEDDAARGVQAALDIRRELTQLGLRTATGITTGRAFCGAVGNATRREYTMIGDVVNLSARLMQAAGDNILCDAATYLAARDSAALELLLGVDLDGSGQVGDVTHFETLPPIHVKGKAHPIEVYRPGSQSRTQVVDPKAINTRLVGRTAERTLLAEHLQALQRHERGSIFIIESDAGMGKSQLVSDLLRQAQVIGGLTLVGAGNAIDQSTPYHSWRPVFSQLFSLDKLPPAGHDAHILDQLVELSPPNEEPAWPDLGPLLNPVLPLDWDDNALTAQMSGKVRADNTSALLIGLLREFARRSNSMDMPYLLVLEDAHWFDSVSWELVLAAAEQVDPLMLVLATRPFTGPPPEAYLRLVGRPATHHLKLEPLTLAETTTLISHSLGVDTIPEALAQLIHRRGEGNPFFCEELAYALREAGLITIDNGRCRLSATSGNLETLNLPDTIQGLITSRIDRLTPSQQLTLKVASVIGRAFAYGTLHDVHPIAMEKANLPQYLSRLNRLEITQLQSQEPTPSYVFKQTITQEVAYNMMLFAQRRELHQAVAAWYERIHADDLSPYYSLLAFHWQQARDSARAIEYLELAGRQALHNFANEEAVQFFSQAIALAAQANADEAGIFSEERLARWEMKLGEAYVNWVKFGEGQAHLEQGLALLGYPIPPTTPQLAYGMLRQLFRQLVHRLTPSWNIFRPRKSRPLLREASQACEGLTAVYYFANKPLLSLFAAFRSLNLAEAAGPSPELARGYTSVGAILGFVPLHGLARLYAARALKAARTIDDFSAQMWVWLGTGMYFAGVGRWAQADQLFGQVIATAERLGDRYRWDDGTGNLAVARYFTGDFTASARLSQEMYHSARRRNDAHNQAWALRSQVYCRLPQGDFNRARTDLRTLEALLNQDATIIDEALRIDLVALLALVCFRLDDADEALSLAAQAAALMRQTQPLSYLSLPGYAALAELYLAMWESLRTAGHPPRLKPRALKTAARRACQSLRGYARVFPVGQARALLWQGMFDWLSGRPYLARQQWHKAIAAASALAMPYDEALAHYQLGRHLPIDDPARLDQLTLACRMFGQLGAGYDLSLAQIALARYKSNPAIEE
jgi:class 3 adenylate cyclase